MTIEKGLIIKKEWLQKFFDGSKIWEMRTTRTNIRGRIALIESGSGLIVGEAYLSACEGPIRKHPGFIMFHQVENLDLLDKWRFAWWLTNIKKYDKPIPYQHPKGAVIWVNIKHLDIN